MPRRFKATKAQLATLRDQGLTMSEAAQVLGVHRNTLTAHVERLGVAWGKASRRHTVPADFSVQRALELREQGVTLDEAANQLGVHRRTLGKWMRRCGYPWSEAHRPWCGSGEAPTRVHARLAELGLSQEDAAARMGVASTAVCALANGRKVLRCDGKRFTGPARRLADVLGRPPEWLWADLVDKGNPRLNITPVGLHLGEQQQEAQQGEQVDGAALPARLQVAMAEVCDQRQRFVLAHRYGLPDAKYTMVGEPMGLAQVGELMGLSRTRVMQIEREALGRLRVFTCLDDFLDLDEPWAVRLQRSRRRAGEAAAGSASRPRASRSDPPPGSRSRSARSGPHLNVPTPLKEHDCDV